MSAELIYALEQIEKEKGISKEMLIEALEAALISAYKRNFGVAQNVKVVVDRITGSVKVFVLKTVEEVVDNDLLEISLEDAKSINKNFDIGDSVEIEVTPKDFGRIAAQTAKQVIVQRIREAERNMVFEEFSNREGDIITGIIQRIEKRTVMIDLGKVEAILPVSEQTPTEEYRMNDRIKTYITEVKKTAKGPQVLVSRTHPGLVKRLFELEVPELHNGLVEIKSIAREPGSRTKIAVYSKDDNVDPIGACVGQRGTRVQAVVDELRGEKIDIIEWSNNPKEFISSSLSPSKVMRVDIDEEEKAARVVVPDYQLSLAIGREGQNARLAAKLSGWKIDIKSETQMFASMGMTVEGEQLVVDEDHSEEEDVLSEDTNDYSEESDKNDED